MLAAFGSGSSCCRGTELARAISLPRLGFQARRVQILMEHGCGSHGEGPGRNLQRKWVGVVVGGDAISMRRFWLSIPNRLHSSLAASRSAEYCMTFGAVLARYPGLRYFLNALAKTRQETGDKRQKGWRRVRYTGNNDFAALRIILPPLYAVSPTLCMACMGTCAQGESLAKVWFFFLGGDFRRLT